MSEELRKEIGSILLQHGGIFLTRNWEKIINALLVLVEREKFKSYADGYADAYKPHCSCEKEKVK